MALEDCGLFDLGMRGRQFTWERGRGTTNWVEERLDSCTIFPQAIVYNKEVITSDHSTIYIEIEGPKLGKELWSHISDSAPDKENEKDKYAKWEVKDAQIMSWILGSVEPSILLSLKPYKTSRGMWDYLKNVYNQSNSARRFQLELELSQLRELLREEQRLTTLAVLEQKAQNSAPIPVAYAAQRRSNGGRDMTKKAGHIIKECSIRPPKKHETAYNVSVGPSSVSNAGQSTITPEMVQQMIVSALSSFGLSGNNTSDSKPWYFDSGASHHMTNTALPLKNVQKYSGDLQIHTADGNSLPITTVGDISASLNNVFVSPKLSTNLISVGQLVDSNCTVQFSKSGCFVQDQVSGKMIAKGPKVGRLFPLFLSSPPVSNYVTCNAVQSNNQVSLWLLRINLRQLSLFHQVPVIPLLFVEALDLTNQLKVWHHIWKLKIPPHVQNYLWRCMHGIVPTMDVLAQRRVTMDLLCPLYVNEDFCTWLLGKLVATADTLKLRCIALCLFIWRERNEVFWNKKTWQPGTIILVVERYMHEWQSILVDSLSNAQAPTAEDMASFNSLSLNFVSVYTDAASWIPRKSLLV
nr:Retrovirus-related Pol polyprotein from transposon TNT 1-94 [Ipomoea batatas]